MQQKELDLKVADQERLAIKDAAELALKARNQDLQEQKAISTEVLEANRIASQNQQAQAKNDIEEAKTILDISKAAGEEKRTRAEAHRDASEAYRDDREDR